jgi:hypothetical protein
VAAEGARLSEAELRLRARPWEATGSVAIDVLVTWALVSQRAGNVVAGLHQLEAQAEGFAWQERTMLAQVEQMEALGCRIDVSGAGRELVHPAAEAVAAAVALAPGGERIARCAREGAPGGWWTPERWFVPERWEIEGERAMWCYVEARQGKHCPLVRVASVDSVERARGEYRGWWDDLEDMAWQLSKRALGFVVGAPSVVREPWAGAGA